MTEEGGTDNRLGDNRLGDNRLGDYLRARRQLVTPEQAGLLPGAHRRVAGLRREEVSLLAGISVDYYLRLERGRDRHPSHQVLESLARVLRLDEVESRYLQDLAAPPPTARRRRRREVVPERLHHLLASIGVPAFVEGRAFDVLASNDLAVALSPRLRPGENRLRSLLLDEQEQSFQDDWAAATADFIGSFRSSVADGADDPRVIELVGELSLSSGRFRELWARHDVRPLRGGSTLVHHPEVGALELHREKLPVGELTLVLYYPAPNSDSAERMRLLGSLAVSTDQAARAISRPTDSSGSPARAADESSR